ncbi:MAG: hypothetical protein K2I63_04035 [Helicobacter sp.]|nr:hypothetical protein [Helicobacter sp.]
MFEIMRLLEVLRMLSGSISGSVENLENKGSVGLDSPSLILGSLENKEGNRISYVWLI